MVSYNNYVSIVVCHPVETRNAVKKNICGNARDTACIGKQFNESLIRCFNIAAAMNYYSVIAFAGKEEQRKK